MRSRSAVISSLLIFCLGAPGASAQERRESIRIAVVPKGANQELWQVIHAGALKARDEFAREGLDVEILWKDVSKLSPRDEQIQVVDTFTGQRLSGILVASLDERFAHRDAQLDGKTKLPTIFFDAALNSNSIISYVATDNFQGGALAADRIGQLTEEEGNVILLRHKQGDINAEAREAGFIERVRRDHKELRLISIDQHAGGAYSEAFSVCETLLNRYGRRVNAIFSSSEVGTRAMISALREFELAGQVFHIGYNSSEESLEAIRSGELHGLIVTNPFRMGYIGITTLVDHIQGRNIPTIVDTGIMLVNQANIDAPEIQEALEPPISEYLR